MKTNGIFKLIVALAVLTISANASAQFSLRVDLGIPEYRIACYNPILVDKAPGIGMQLGVDYDFHVKKSFYITSGLYWSGRSVVFSAAEDNVSGSEILMENFLNLPVHAKWKFNIKPEKFGMYLYVGPTFSCGLKSHSMIDMYASGVAVEGSYDYFSKDIDVELPPMYNHMSDELEAAIQEELDGLQFTRFEFRVDWGVGFVFKEHYELVVGYDAGINNKYIGNYAQNYNMICQHSYIGFRYRFGKKAD